MALDRRFLLDLYNPNFGNRASPSQIFQLWRRSIFLDFHHHVHWFRVCVCVCVYVAMILISRWIHNKMSKCMYLRLKLRSDSTKEEISSAR